MSDLNRSQMGNWFVIQQRHRKNFLALRKEFVRRYWAEQELSAAAGSQLRLYPFDR